MKLRRVVRQAEGLFGICIFIVFLGAGFMLGCDGGPPPLPPGALDQVSKPSVKVENGRAKKNKKVSDRDHDEESNAERFQRRAREAREKQAQ